MSKIIAVKVSDELKKKVDKFKDKINWPEEIRLFIERKIREIEAQEKMKNIIEDIEKTGGVPKGFSVLSVREDRESG
ncbi:MAG: CopG family transcriptional regulator [Nitrososphaeria archaeon]